ncbi:hypothetical protein BDQ17DRAFT_1419508 [Cyathus striatus]|nr:hypothetical protein BDQ17DRAFT_1419508 [Cyathus striatus]
MFSARALSRAVATCTRTIQASSAVRPPAMLHPCRSFSSSPIARASEPSIDPQLFEKVKTSPVVKKMVENPEVMEALKDLHKFLQSNGIPIGKPSAFQMIKLAANSDFRAAASRLMEEMQKAGIDVKSKEVLNEIMSISKLSGGPGKPDESK